MNVTKIGAFLAIAFQAGKRKVRKIIDAAVLARNGALIMKTQVEVFCGGAAVFATLSRPLAHELPARLTDKTMAAMEFLTDASSIKINRPKFDESIL